MYKKLYKSEFYEMAGWQRIDYMKEHECWLNFFYSFSCIMFFLMLSFSIGCGWTRAKGQHAVTS